MPSLEQQLRAIEKKLQPKINKAIEIHVQETVKDVMIESINDVVYSPSVYEPTMYLRREDNGGLGDRRNIEGRWENNVFVMRNMTRGDGEPNKYLDEVIISGVGYTWFHSKIYQMQPFPRDYISETVKRLESSGKHIDAMRRGLKAQGLNVE